MRWQLGGDADRALASIQRALDCDSTLAADIAHDSDFADPRFRAIVGEGN